MATNILRDSFPMDLNDLYWLVKDHATDVADVTTMVEALISSAGPQLSDLTLRELRRLVYIVTKTHHNTQIGDRGTCDKVHDLIHDGLTTLTAADASENHQSGLSQLIDLESLAYIKVDVAKWHAICPIMKGVSICYRNVDAAIEDKKSALSLLPMQAWFQEDQSNPDALPYDILEQAIYTAMALKHDKDTIYQLIARVLSSTQTRKQVAEMVEKLRRTGHQHLDEPLGDVLDETFRLLALKDDKAIPVQVIDTKVMDTPKVLPEPVDEILLPTQTPILVQQMQNLHDDREENNSVIGVECGPFDRGVVELPTPIDEINENKNQTLTDLAESESDKELSGEGVCVPLHRVDSLATEIVEEKQAHQEARINAERDALSRVMEVKGLQTQLEGARIEKMDMKLQLENLEACKDSLETALSAKENTIEKFQQGSHSDQSSKEAMTSHVEELEVKVVGLEKNLAAEEKAHKDIQALLDIVQSNLMDLNATIGEEKAGLTKPLTAREPADQQSHKVNMALEIDSEIFKKLLAAEKEKSQELQDRFNFVQSSKEALALTNATLTCTVDHLQESLSAAEDTNTELQKRFDDVCCERKASNAKNVEADQKALGRALAARQKDLEEIESNPASCIAAKNDHLKTLKAYVVELQLLKAETHARKESDANLEHANALIHQHETMISRLFAQKDQLNAAFGKGHIMLANEKEAHIKTKNNLSDTIDCWASEIQALQSYLTDALTRETNLLDAIAELESSNERLTAKLDAAGKIGVETAANAEDAESIGPATSAHDDAVSDADSWVGIEDMDDSDAEATERL